MPTAISRQIFPSCRTHCIIRIREKTEIFSIFRTWQIVTVFSMNLVISLCVRILIDIKMLQHHQYPFFLASRREWVFLAISVFLTDNTLGIFHDHFSPQFLRDTTGMLKSLFLCIEQFTGSIISFAFYRPTFFPSRGNPIIRHGKPPASLLKYEALCEKTLRMRYENRKQKGGIPRKARKKLEKLTKPAMLRMSISEHSGFVEPVLSASSNSVVLF